MSALPPVLVWGTGPNSSKSHVCLALLRLLARREIPVAPFKAITVLEPERWRHGPAACPIPHHVAAARTIWRTAMSPVVVELANSPDLLTGLLRVRGEPCGTVPLLTPDTLDGADLPVPVRERVRAAILAALAELSRSGQTVVAEGAGSPVDATDDLANRLVASELRGARIILSAYCRNGGSTAAVIGTLDCLPAQLRRAVVGFVQNRPASPRAARRWAEIITERTGVAMIGLVGDLSRVRSADLVDTSDSLADPWADAFAAHADLSWLFEPQRPAP